MARGRDPVRRGRWPHAVRPWRPRRRDEGGRGTGRGGARGIVRLRPSAGGEDKLRAALSEQLDPAQLDGIISMHLIESDPALSKPITDDPSAPNPGAGDWFVLIDATDVGAVPAAMLRFSGNIALKPLTISS